MKKRLLLLLAVFGLSLVACSGGSESTEAESEATTEAAGGEETEADASEGETEAEASEGETEAEVSFETVTTEDVEAALEDEGSIVLDARFNDVFNGWTDSEGNRGGHLPGATDFSAAWITGIYDEEANLEGKSREEVLTEALETKGITADKNIIVYDTNGEDAKVVADYLSQNGFENVSLYDANEWIADDAKELLAWENYNLLVSPQVVNDLIEENEAESFEEATEIVIVDVSWGDDEQSGYLEGHIPGAIHVNTDSFEPPHEYVEGIEEWRLADDESLIELALSLGIDKDTTVIATGPEPMAASRFAFICEYLGVEDVRVLNGGLVNWQNQGYELETEGNQASAKEEFGADYPAKPDILVTMEEMEAALGTDEYQLLDVRTWAEYIGESSGYDYHDKAGRIEGALYGRAGLKSGSSMYYYRNLDKTMRNPEEIDTMLIENNIDTSKALTHMCGSGWRAGESYWYGKVIGREGDSMFSDGWIAWSNEEKPSVTGVPEGYEGNQE